MRASEQVSLGIDIGATTTRIALVDPRGNVLAKRSTPTPHDPPARHNLADWLVENSAELSRADPNLAAIGLAVPGLVDAARRTITRAVNLAYVKGDWLPRTLTDRLGLAITLHSDIDAATWAEYQSIRNAQSTAPPRNSVGATDTSFRLAHVRIGSGIGLGVVADDHLQVIEPNRNTHARVLIVDERDDAPACPCGLRGCLETFVSGQQLMAGAHSIGIEPNLPALQQAVDEGFVPALAFVDAVGEPIARAIENIRQSYAIDTVVLGGGVLEHLPALRLSIERHVAQRSARPGPTVPRLERARLADDAGVIGAALRA